MTNKEEEVGSLEDKVVFVSVKQSERDVYYIDGYIGIYRGADNTFVTLENAFDHQADASGHRMGYFVSKIVKIPLQGVYTVELADDSRIKEYNQEMESEKKLQQEWAMTHKNL